MRWKFGLAAGAAAAVVACTSVTVVAQGRKANPANPQDQAQIKERMNLNTVVIAAGNPSSTDLPAAYDLSTVLDDGDNLRVLAFMGKGGAQNVRDSLWLKNVDMGITQANVMAHFRKTGELGANLEGRLVYITTLFNEELHVIGGQSIASLKDLAGKTVNFAEAGSGTQLTGQLLFEALKIKVNEVNLTLAEALLKIKSGEIAATLLLAGKPAPVLERIGNDGGELKLIPIPYEEELEADYLPSKLTASDYPTLLAEGETIETISVPSVLAAYNWAQGSDRHRRLSRFVEAFFSKFPEFRKAPRHPKWHEVNLSAELRGWRRFPPAQAWLDARKPQTAAAPASAAQPGRGDFERFLAEQKGQPAPKGGARNQEEALFQRFMEWSRRQGGGAPAPAGVAPAGAAQTAPAQQPAQQSSGTRLW